MSAPHTTTNLIRGCLVAQVSGDWDDEYLRTFQQTVIQQLNHCKAKQLVIDISSVNSVDSLFVNAIKDTAKMASLLGAHAQVTGVTPGVAAAIVALDLDWLSTSFSGTLESALASPPPSRADVTTQYRKGSASFQTSFTCENPGSDNEN